MNETPLAQIASSRGLFCLHQGEAHTFLHIGS